MKLTLIFLIHGLELNPCLKCKYFTKDLIKEDRGLCTQESRRRQYISSAFIYSGYCSGFIPVRYLLL